MAKLTPPGPPKQPGSAPRREFTPQDAKEEAEVIGLREGATRIEWIPWVNCPEEQWVPIRTATIPELDNAYLFAHGKCENLKRPDDPILFERFERLAILSHALRDGTAFQKGFAPDGSVILDKKEENFDFPMFTTPDHLRTSLRDLEALTELWNYYREHCVLTAPLSTAKRLAREGEFERLIKMLKKKPGPIDITGFAQIELLDLWQHLLAKYPTGDDTPE